MDTSQWLFFSFMVTVIMALIVSAAAHLKGYKRDAWFLYALFLWPVALVHIAIKPAAPKLTEKRSLASGSTKKCPDCAEPVRAEARKCRYCGAMFPEAPTLEA